MPPASMTPNTPPAKPTSIGSRLAQLVSETAIYGVSSVLGRFVGFVLVPIYARLFVPAEYGVIGVGASLFGVITLIVTFGLDQAVVRFYYGDEEESERRSMVFTWIVFQFTASAVLGGVLWLASEQLAGYFLRGPGDAILLRLLSVAAVLESATMILKIVLRTQRRPWLFVALTLGKTIATAVLTIIFVVGLKLGLFGVYLAMVVAAVPLFAVNVWFLRQWVSGASFSRTWLSRLLRFGLPVAPSSFAAWAIQALDRMFIEHYAGLPEVGRYTVAASITAAIAVLVAAFRQAWIPFSMSIRSDANSRDVYAAVMTYYLASASALSVVLTLFATEIVTLIATARYAAAAPVIALLAFGWVGQGAYHIASRGVTEVKKTGHIGWTTFVAAAISVGLNLLLIPSLGMLGAAIAGMAAQWSATLLILAMSQRHYPIPYRARDAAIILIASVAVIAAGLNAPTSTMTSAVLKPLLVLVYLAALDALHVLPIRKVASAVLRRFSRRSSGVR